MYELTDQEQRDLDLYQWGHERERDGVEWLQIFPEALKRWGPVIMRQLKALVVMRERQLEHVTREVEEELYDNKYQWRDDYIKQDGRKRMAHINKEILSTQWKIACLKGLMGGEEPSGEINASTIAQAKRYPLGQLIEINRQGFAKCVWHTDTKPSMYCRNNFAHCFSCGKNGDTISVVMATEGLSFVEAVKRLQ